MADDEEGRVAAGAPERDLSAYSEWRERTDLTVQEAMEMYGAHLVGQTAGMSDALSLTAVMAAFELEDIERDRRPGMVWMLNRIHTHVRDIVALRNRKVGRG